MKHHKDTPERYLKGPLLIKGVPYSGYFETTEYVKGFRIVTLWVVTRGYFRSILLLSSKRASRNRGLR